MSTQWQLRWLQLTVLAIFLIVGGLSIFSKPFNAGPDEVAHFQFTRFIAKYGRLPTAHEERLEAGYKSDWPPLFHLLAGTAGWNINLDRPPFVKIAQDNPRLQLVVGHKNIISWRALTTEDPYQSEILLWYVARWVTLLSGVAGVVAIYLLVRASYPDKPWLALNAAALIAFMPTYIGISSVISYEPLLGTLLAFYFLLLFYTVQQPAKNWSYLGLGLLIGLALLTKYTPLPALPILPLVVIWLAYRYKWTGRLTLLRLMLIGLGLSLTFGSWFVFTEVYFNRINELGWIPGLLSPFIDSSDQTSNRILNAVISGNFGGINQSKSGDSLLAWGWHVFKGIWGGKWFGWLFLGLWACAIAGLVRQWPSLSQKIRLWILLLVAHIALFGFFPLVRFLMTRDLSTGMGQHILFPAGGAMILLLMSGLGAWLAPANLTKLLAVLAVLYLGVNLIRLNPGAEATWPIQTVPLSANEQVLTTFGDISLIDYEHVANGQILSTTLYWRTEAFLNEDYLIELTLLDTDSEPRARWSGQPLNGRYPTRAWQPGDRIRNAVQIPVAGLPPGDYQLRLNLVAEAVAIRAEEANTPPAKQVVRDYDSFSLGQVSLRPRSEFDGDEIQLGAQIIGYRLWHQNRSGTARPTFGERATITISTREDLGDDIYLSLIGPDDQPYHPVDRVGHIYNFSVEPYFLNGEYRLRFEQRSGDRSINYAETDALLRIETEERHFEVGAISYRVNADFAGHIRLLGYDLSQRRVQAGEKLPVTLYWQALKTISADLVMFNHLIDENQEIWGGQDRRPRNIYSTFLWAPGEIVTDSYPVQIDAGAPDGIYNLLVGTYLPVGEAPVYLPLVEDGQLTDITNISIGPIKIGNTLPGLTLESANPQVLVGQSFGDPPAVTLLGYDLADQTNRPVSVTATAGAGQSSKVEGAYPLASLTLSLYWRSESILPIDYTTFVHVRDEAGNIIVQKDQPPLQGAYPTSLWDPGEIIADEITISLPAEFAPGEYQLVIGLYDRQTGQRLAVPGGSDNSLFLGVLQSGS